MHNPLPTAGSNRATGYAGRSVALGQFRQAGMRERGAMIWAKLDAQTAVECGTVVILELPL
jgi:hypothetical protein